VRFSTSNISNSSYKFRYLLVECQRNKSTSAFATVDNPSAMPFKLIAIFSLRERGFLFRGLAIGGINTKPSRIYAESIRSTELSSFPLHINMMREDSMTATMTVLAMCGPNLES
jgi:hypothetical protein